MDRLHALVIWMSKDPDIKRVVNATLMASNSDTLKQLHDTEPELFGELYEAMEAMVEDIPIHEEPRFM